MEFQDHFLYRYKRMYLRSLKKNTLYDLLKITLKCALISQYIIPVNSY